MDYNLILNIYREIMANLTRQQQEFLYSGQVKQHISFQQELNNILNNTELTIENKELILKACISESSEFPADATPSVVIMKEFLTVCLAIDNSTILCSDAMKEDKSSPTLEEIQNYYIQCVQSHLQTPVVKEELYKPPQCADTPIDKLLDRFPEYQNPLPYRPLSEKDLICLYGLNLLLMSQAGENTPAKLSQRIEDNSKFMEVTADLFEMVEDLKDMVANKRQTTSKPQYEMIYREFFSLYGLSPNSLKELSSLKPAHDALLLLRFRVTGERLLNNFDESEWPRVRDFFVKALDNPSPEIVKEAMKMLFSSHLQGQEDERAGILAGCVAKGKQEEVDEILTHHPDRQNLIFTPGVFTDYSDRTFNCTAYEYAYWAKDTHMCRMLEKHMDEPTKEYMLERCKIIEKDGLDYSQHGVVKNPKHFDLTKLITL